MPQNDSNSGNSSAVVDNKKAEDSYDLIAYKNFCKSEINTLFTALGYPLTDGDVIDAIKNISSAKSMDEVYNIAKNAVYNNDIPGGDDATLERNFAQKIARKKDWLIRTNNVADKQPVSGGVTPVGPQTGTGGGSIDNQVPKAPQTGTGGGTLGNQTPLSPVKTEAQIFKDVNDVMVQVFPGYKGDFSKYKHTASYLDFYKKHPYMSLGTLANQIKNDAELRTFADENGWNPSQGEQTVGDVPVPVLEKPAYDRNTLTQRKELDRRVAAGEVSQAVADKVIAEMARQDADPGDDSGLDSLIKWFSPKGSGPGSPVDKTPKPPVTPPADTRTKEQKDADFYAAASSAIDAAKNGNDQPLRNFDKYFGITRPEEEYTKAFYNKPQFTLIKGDGPNLGNDTLQGNGAAVYAVNQAGQKFHVTSQLAQIMRANGTWTEPEVRLQKEVDAIPFRGELNDLASLNKINDPGTPGPIVAFNDPASSVIAGSATTADVNKKHEDPSKVPNIDTRINSSNLKDPSDPSRVPTIRDRADAPGVNLGTWEPQDKLNPTVAVGTPPVPPTGSYVRNTKDSGFAYPWSAAKATGTTDVMGTIGKAVDFMNAQEGKTYKYDSVKGTIQASDGSFISKDDVQALNNIITTYQKTDFKLSASAGGATPHNDLPIGFITQPVQGPEVATVGNVATKIDTNTNNLHTLDSGAGIAGAAVSTKPNSGGFSLPGQ